MDEATTRAAKWRIDSVSAMIVAALTLKKRQKARQDETGAEVPDAIYPMMRGEIVVQTLD